MVLKKWKIGITMILVFAMVSMVGSVGFAENQSELSDDVAASETIATEQEKTDAENGEPASWKYPEAKIDENGMHVAYMEVGSTSFRPYDYLTRSELCSIFTTAFYVYDNGIDATFSDVMTDAWYHPYVMALTEAGIVGGYPDGTFRPDGLVSRAELVAVLSKAYQVEEATPIFTDAQGHWAKNQIAFANNLGWIRGYDDGTFRPEEPVNRGEAIAVINRVLGRSAAKSVTMLQEKNLAPYYDVMPYDWFYGDVMEATVTHKAMGTGTEEIWETFDYPQTGLTQGVHRIGNNGCIVDGNGQFLRHAANTTISIGEKMYHTNAIGYVDMSQIGLSEWNGGLYYVQDDGSLLVNQYLENLYFGADGKYTTGNVELDGMVEEALARCVTDNMAKWEKLRAAYLYLRDNCVYLSRAHHPRGSTAFAPESAMFMFQHMKGNCYCYASCFLYMARRIGYSNAEIISGGVGTNNQDHAWVMIDSKIFDPELEYAYRYRYAKKRNYNLYDMSVNSTPFPYIFPN